MKTLIIICISKIQNFINTILDNIDVIRNKVDSIINNAYTVTEATKREPNIMMPLMPKSTADWLINNTTLTFEQISSFCGLHMLEVQAIADDTASKITPFDPIAHMQLTKAEIIRCEKDPEARLIISAGAAEQFKQKEAKHASKVKRQDRPNGILWIVRQHPEVTDIVVSKLLHTTKSTVEAIRNKSYKNYSALHPQNPVSLGLCNQVELDAVLR